VEASVGRRDRFVALVDAVRDPVWRFLVRRTDAETAAEVLNDVLVVLWRRLDEVPDESALPWAYAVARGCLSNATRADARRRRLWRRIAVLDPPSLTASDPVGATLATAGLDADDVTAALAALGADDREVLTLWAWEHLQPAEIAVVLGISANAVSIRLHRAKARLRERLLAVADTKPVREEGLTP
jgi:RNA polymerase sigma-70 factor (ECF subfamily)